MEMTESISEKLADAVASAGAPPREVVEKLLVDVAGLCVAARNTEYVRAALDGWESSGGCSALGHERALDSGGAAFVNGTAAHGEDFDDTFEGGPIHAGAVIVPAVLAICEREKIAGKDALRAMAVGLELTCRASLVAPKMIHKAGFHPTAVLGAMGAAAAAAVALKLPKALFVNALGIAGSMAAGIIEYLAEGTWTKRMHPGWAAQSGIRAADLAEAGFVGPRTVFEGEHGLYHGFARTTAGQWDKLLDGFGSRWVTSTIAFKLYPCGTMTHPYIDCARRLSRKIAFENIEEIVCEACGRHAASTVGAAGGEAAPAERLRREIQHPLLHRERLRARQRRAGRVHRGARARPAPGRPCRQGALRGRPGQPVPRRVHRACARQDEGRQG
jgi:2-methylcitrate dehydratase PrpD